MRKISSVQLIESLKSTIHDLLRHPREITITWGIEDVQTVRRDLNADQAWAVLKRCANKYDSGLGINWNTLEFVANELFPERED